MGFYSFQQTYSEDVFTILHFRLVFTLTIYRPCERRYLKHISCFSYFSLYSSSAVKERAVVPDVIHGDVTAAGLGPMAAEKAANQNGPCMCHLVYNGIQ